MNYGVFWVLNCRRQLCLVNGAELPLIARHSHGVLTNVAIFTSVIEYIYRPMYKGSMDVRSDRYGVDH